MTIGGAIAELQNLLDAEDIPFFYKPVIQKVIETIEMDTSDCPHREYPCAVCDMQTDCSWK